MEKLKVIGWTTYDSPCQNIIVTQENQREVIECLMREIAEHGYEFCGDQHQSSGVLGVPVFNNGKCYRATMRAFAFIMAMAHDTNDYMNYYMALSSDVKDFVMPSEKVEESVFVFHEGHDAVLPAMCKMDLQVLRETFGMPFITDDKALKANMEYMQAHYSQKD